MWASRLCIAPIFGPSRLALAQQTRIRLDTESRARSLTFAELRRSIRDFRVHPFVVWRLFLYFLAADIREQLTDPSGTTLVSTKVEVTFFSKIVLRRDETR